ncbi:hypothetical protein ES332_D10G125300v1 [Gossypium tomentosum]|uniref:Uncharacterized protein n=1 Tax=Gossypium tomentosum TaxID=34277 RepID=A0A5D2J3Z4_GOSTO|nr:hypothetical protein ES332_D10G125300v1 [Gossypium tomentosum]
MCLLKSLTPSICLHRFPITDPPPPSRSPSIHLRFSNKIVFKKQLTLKSIWLTLASFPISRFSHKLKLLIY